MCVTLAEDIRQYLNNFLFTLIKLCITMHKHENCQFSLSFVEMKQFGYLLEKKLISKTNKVSSKNKIIQFPISKLNPEVRGELEEGQWKWIKIELG